jgi:hypothetical protein
MRSTALVLSPVLLVLAVIAVAAYVDHTNGVLIWDALAVSVTVAATTVAAALGSFLAYADYTERRD